MGVVSLCCGDVWRFVGIASYSCGRRKYIFEDANLVIHYWFSNFVINVPTCGCNTTANSSPTFKNSLGFFAAPTPGGVPVRMMVPAGRVVPCERKLISWGTLKIRSLHSISVSELASKRGHTGLGLTLTGNLA